MKRITVVIGHPRPGSLSHGLAESYVSAAKEAGAEVRVIDLAQASWPLAPIEFHDEELAHANATMPLSPALAQMTEDLVWAEHLVIVHPVWWGTYPAALKDFIDSAFLPGVTFKYRSDGSGWDKLLKGRTARLIYTMDAPGWFHRFWYRKPSENSLRYPILWYCGVKTIGATSFSPVRKSTLEQRTKWLQAVARFGGSDALK